MTEGEFTSGLWSEQLPCESFPGCVSLLSVSWEPVRSWVRAPHAHGSRLLQPHGATFWAFPQASGTQGAPFLAWGSMVGVWVCSFSDSQNSISSWPLPLGNVGFPPPQHGQAESGGGRGVLWAVLAHTFLLRISLRRICTPSSDPRVFRRVMYSAK